MYAQRETQEISYIYVFIFRYVVKSALLFLILRLNVQLNTFILTGKGQLKITEDECTKLIVCGIFIFITDIKEQPLT